MEKIRGSGAVRNPSSFHAPALVLQDFAYSYRVWIILIKLPYAPLRCSLTTTSIHARERLCTPLLPSVRRVSEKNSSRQLGEQAGRHRTPLYRTAVFRSCLLGTVW